MSQQENTTPHNVNKTLTAQQLRDLLLNPPKSFIKDSYGEKSILISGYTVEDEYLILDDSISVDLPLTFEGCTFKSDKSLFISGLICNAALTFDGCIISGSIFFNSGTFKDVVLKYVRVNKVHLSSCKFENISISGYDIDEVWMARSKFESLNIGEHLIGDHIKKLVIFAKEDETGDINAREQGFDEIHLYGTNKGRTFNFEKVKCDIVSITNFKNEGALNFYGIEPKNLKNDRRYFQIINSNLEKVQFYRAHFSQYNELVIIDSFITDTLFIGCKWSNNLRALQGPGYATFEDSLKTGRKITDKEVVAIREAYRQLKISMSKHSDKIQEHKFYSQELSFYNKSLSWQPPWTNQFWDKIILLFSRSFSDFGQSFVKPLSWLLVGHFILFLIALLLNGYYPLRISFSEPTATGFEEAFEKFFIYINPLRRLETSLSGYLILLDFLMRIWSSYMIYNIIRASRRFIS